VEIVGQELDGLVGDLGEFVRAGELVERGIDAVEQIAYGNALRAAAVGQGVLGAEAGLRIEERLRPFEIELGPAEIKIALMQGQIAVKTQMDIVIQYGAFLGGQSLDTESSQEQKQNDSFWHNVLFINYIN
jgi:hypothetical protein